MQGTESAKIDRVNFTRCESNGVFLSGYNKGAEIRRSSFEWLGASAIASEGFSKAAPDEEHSPEADAPRRQVPLPAGVGVDATDGEYPQGTRISDVWVHDIGLLQKQSSAYFQAVTCCATIER